MLEEAPHHQILLDMGLWPEHKFRMRPDGNLFTQYAFGHCQAARRMPKLEFLYFFVDKVDSEYWAQDGFVFIADKSINGPRTDWLFKSGEQQLLGRTQPDEASRIWRENCGDALDESVITKEGDDTDCVSRRRFRDGRQVDHKSYTDHYAGRMDLFEE